VWTGSSWLIELILTCEVLAIVNAGDDEEGWQYVWIWSDRSLRNSIPSPPLSPLVCTCWGWQRTASERGSYRRCHVLAKYSCLTPHIYIITLQKIHNKLTWFYFMWKCINSSLSALKMAWVHLSRVLYKMCLTLAQLTLSGLVLHLIDIVMILDCFLSSCLYQFWNLREWGMNNTKF
jgi:hypothetical protein